MTFLSIRRSWYSRLISLCLMVTFVTTMVITPKAQAGVMGLPQPGTMVDLSPAYVPLMITGLTVHPENPLLMDFIVSTGNSGLNADQVKKQSDRLIKYFLACLTIPENNQWVNLSPYEKQRIIPEDLGQTVLGRDMLAQDYILKQLTASLIYPEKNLGKNFWDTVYAKARQMYGTTQIPVNTFNKVWILPQYAKVYTYNNTVFVVKSHLKVMLDEDYLALQKHSVILSEAKDLNRINSIRDSSSAAPQNDVNALGSQIIRQIILPAIEKEVNTGKNFARLRQIYNSMILAVWFKKNLKQALLNQVYTDKSKINGVNVDDPAIKEKIYQQYLQAYKKGVFNYIKEDIAVSLRGGGADEAISKGTMIPRKYFSGGVSPFGEEQVTGEPAAKAMLDISSAEAQDPEDKEFKASTAVGPAINGMTPPYITPNSTASAAMTVTEFKEGLRGEIDAARNYAINAGYRLFSVTLNQGGKGIFTLDFPVSTSTEKALMDTLNRPELLNNEANQYSYKVVPKLVDPNASTRSFSWGDIVIFRSPVSAAMTSVETKAQFEALEGFLVSDLFPEGQRDENMYQMLYQRISGSLEKIYEKRQKKLNSTAKGRRVIVNKNDPGFDPADPEDGSEDVNIGVLAISANPVHWGQLETALRSMAEGDIDQVVVIVQGDDFRKPILKKTEDDRHQMVKQLLDRFGGLLVYSDWSKGNRNIGEDSTPEMILRNIQAGRKGKVTWHYIVGNDHGHWWAPDAKSADATGVRRLPKGYNQESPSNQEKWEEDTLQRLYKWRKANIDLLRQNGVELKVGLNVREDADGVWMDAEKEQLEAISQEGFFYNIAGRNLPGTSSTKLRKVLSGQLPRSEATFIMESMYDYIMEHGQYRGLITELPEGIRLVADAIQQGRTISDKEKNALDQLEKWIEIENQHGHTITPETFYQMFFEGIDQDKIGPNGQVIQVAEPKLYVSSEGVRQVFQEAHNLGYLPSSQAMIVQVPLKGVDSTEGRGSLLTADGATVRYSMSFTKDPLSSGLLIWNPNVPFEDRVEQYIRFQSGHKELFAVLGPFIIKLAPSPKASQSTLVLGDYLLSVYYLESASKLREVTSEAFEQMGITKPTSFHLESLPRLDEETGELILNPESKLSFSELLSTVSKAMQAPASHLTMSWLKAALHQNPLELSGATQISLFYNDRKVFLVKQPNEQSAGNVYSVFANIVGADTQQRFRYRREINDGSVAIYINDVTWTEPATPVFDLNNPEGHEDYWLQQPVSTNDLVEDMFRDYDYRFEKKGQELKPAIVFRLGLVWAKMAIEKAKKAGIDSRTVLIARDARRANPEIMDALVAAMRYSGLDVVYTAAETPNAVTSYSWAVQQFKPLMSIFHTASHVSRPADTYVRGFKVAIMDEIGVGVKSLTTKEIKQYSLPEVKKLLETPDEVLALRSPKLGDFRTENIDENTIRFNSLVGVVAASNGSLYELGETLKKSDDPVAVLTEYEQRYGNAQPLKGIKIVVDGSHTPSGILAVRTFERLGAEVISLNTDIQEIWGAHNADPSVKKNLVILEAKIKETGAHFGLAFDLDGDRGAILVPESTNEVAYKEFHSLAPDNLLGVLLPSLVNQWGYAEQKTGKKLAIIRDVLGTHAVNDIGKELGIDVYQTDSGYPFLKARKQVLEKEGVVVPMYGERSGHTWLHVSGEIENPLAVAVLFAVLAKRKMDVKSVNPVLDVYKSLSIPYAQSPRFQPLFHPEFLEKLGNSPDNHTTWRYDPEHPTNPPTAVVGLGKDIGIKILQQYFVPGKSYETSVGNLVVRGIDSYVDPVEEGGLGRYADIVFEQDGKFAGRFVFRASSNDPSFVNSYEAPQWQGEDIQTTNKRKAAIAKLVLNFLREKKIALVTKEDISGSMHLSGEKLDTVYNTSNLAPVEADLQDRAMSRGEDDIPTQGDEDTLTTSTASQAVLGLVHYNGQKGEILEINPDGQTATVRWERNGQPEHVDAGVRMDWLLKHADATQAIMPGGIDLNSRNLNMESSGQKINITFDPAMIAQFKRGDFSGVKIQVMDVVPINLMLYLGLKEDEVGAVG